MTLLLHLRRALQDLNKVRQTLREIHHRLAGFVYFFLNLYISRRSTQTANEIFSHTLSTAKVNFSLPMCARCLQLVILRAINPHNITVVNINIDLR